MCRLIFPAIRHASPESQPHAFHHITGTCNATKSPASRWVRSRASPRWKPCPSLETRSGAYVICVWAGRRRRAIAGTPSESLSSCEYFCQVHVRFCIDVYVRFFELTRVDFKFSRVIHVSSFSSSTAVSGWRCLYLDWFLLFHLFFNMLSKFFPSWRSTCISALLDNATL